jgi:hypothetical protein
MGRNTAARPRTPAPANGPILMARLVDVAGALVVVTAPTVPVVLLTVLTAVLELSVDVLLTTPVVTVDSLTLVSVWPRSAEKGARTYLVASLDVAVSIVVAGACNWVRM